MVFPVVFSLGPWQVPAHGLFEMLAYVVGFRLYLWLKRRQGDVVSRGQRGWVFAAAVLGAAAGSKGLYLLVDPQLTAQHLGQWGYLLGGKTIVGALAGGLLAVELAKKALGIRRATGDLYALPLIVGMAIGRVGCFLSGLEDRTHGLPTTLPWGVELGDGVLRHPVQLYEIGFLALLGALIVALRGRPLPEGARFKWFLGGYMGFRFAIEALKPGIPLGGLTAIQWVCLAVMIHYGAAWLRHTQRSFAIPHG